MAGSVRGDAAAAPGADVAPLEAVEHVAEDGHHEEVDGELETAVRRRHHRQHGGVRHVLPQAVELAHVARAGLVVDDAGGHEQRGLEGRVVHDVEHCGDRGQRRADAEQQRLADRDVAQFNADRQAVEQALVDLADLYVDPMRGTAARLWNCITRALIAYDESLRKPLRKAGFVTRDAREVERKKVGLRKARKKEQYSKR